MSFALNPFISVGTAGGVGGGGGDCDCTTAGSGGVYSTLAAAVLAGERHIRVVGPSTETQSVYFNDDYYIELAENSTVNMGSNIFNWNGNYAVEIDGNGILQYATTSGSLFYGNGNSSAKLTVEGINIQNSSSGTVCLTDIRYARFHDVIFDGNVSICGDYNLYGDCIYRNGTVKFESTAENSHVAGAVYENMLAINSGVNCIFSDALVG